MKKNEILELSFQFALGIIQYSETLAEKKKFIVANQILKSGTSIGANVREAQSPQSRTDFIHKLKIASKEAQETQYWLLLCKFSKDYPDCENLLIKIESILKLLTKIIYSSKQNKSAS